MLIDGNSSISINASIHDDDAVHVNNSNGDNKSSSTLPIQSQSTQQKDEVTNETSPSFSPPPPPSPSFTDNVIEENVDDVTSSQQAAKAPIKPKSKKGVKKPCGNPYGLCGMDNVPT